MKILKPHSVTTWNKVIVGEPGNLFLKNIKTFH